MLTTLFDDFRFGLRVLTAHKAFATVLALTLAIGIGVNTAVFGFVNALLLHPYDFPAADDLVLVRAAGPHVLSEYKIAPADITDLRADATLFAGAAAFRQRESNLTVNGESAQPVITCAVSANFLDLIGVGASRGRLFAAGEDQPGHEAVVVISDRLWRQHFGADPAIVGRTIELDGAALAVIGVMPTAFSYPPATDVWQPLALGADVAAQRDVAAGSPTYQVLARLPAATSLAAAEARLRMFAAQLAQQYPDSHRDRALRLVRLRDEQFGFSGPPFLILQAAALLILILAGANALNLMLVRIIERDGELAARCALGANRRRIAQALIAEIAPILAVAAIAATIAAHYAVRAIRDSVPSDYTQWIAGWNQIAVDHRVIAFALALTVVVAAAAIGCAALRSGGRDVAAVLNQVGRGGGAVRHRALAWLVVAQLVFATALLGGTGLMIRGFFGATQLYAKLDPARVVGLRVSLPEQRYATDVLVRDFYRRLLDDAGALAGVESIGAIANPPASNVDNPRTTFTSERDQGLPQSERPAADLQVVGGAIFAALRLPLLQGRDFSAGDDERAAAVALVSRTLATQLHSDADVVGSRIRIDSGAASDWTTIVGVVDDVRQNWWDPAPRPVVYRPLAQAPKRVMQIEARSRGDNTALAIALRAAVRRLDASLSLVSVQTLDTEITDALAPLRILRLLLGVFGAMAALLAAIGLFGLLAHSVAQRAHEFGVRAAVGARRTDLLRHVLVQTLRFCAVGAAIGAPLAWAFALAMHAALPGIVALDVPTVLGCTATVVLIALIAGAVPARRAMRIDPVDSLRGG